MRKKKLNFENSIESLEHVCSTSKEKLTQLENCGAVNYNSCSFSVSLPGCVTCMLCGEIMFVQQFVKQMHDHIESLSTLAMSSRCK